MAPDNEETTVTLPTPLGPVAVRGAMALLALMGIAIGSLFWVQMDKNAQEHAKLQCLIRLNLYQQTVLSKGESVNLWKMPADLYECLPRFMTEPRQQ